MLITAHDVIALASELGTTAGLERVKREIELLNVCLAEGMLPCSRENLPAMSAALASLSEAVIKMNRIAQAMLSEAGVSADYVG
jgi:hypothetical protein